MKKANKRRKQRRQKNKEKNCRENYWGEKKLKEKNKKN